MVWDRSGSVVDLQVASASDIECVLHLFFILFSVVLTGLIERKALEQTLIDEEDEEEDDDARYLNLEGEDDGEYICFFFFSFG